MHFLLAAVTLLNKICFLTIIFIDSKYSSILWRDYLKSKKIMPHPPSLLRYSCFLRVKLARMQLFVRFKKIWFKMSESYLNVFTMLKICFNYNLDIRN